MHILPWDSLLKSQEKLSLFLSNLSTNKILNKFNYSCSLLLPEHYLHLILCTPSSKILWNNVFKYFENFCFFSKVVCHLKCQMFPLPVFSESTALLERCETEATLSILLFHSNEKYFPPQRNKCTYFPWDSLLRWGQMKNQEKLGIFLSNLSANKFLNKFSSTSILSRRMNFANWTGSVLLY